jgi:hypothetical protein
MIQPDITRSFRGSVLNPQSCFCSAGKGVPTPAFYKIDKERKLVLSSGSGVLTREDVLGHQERLSRDPDFDPSFSQLSDFTHITKIELTPEDVRLAAKKNIFSPESRRAMVVNNDLQFGLARMFEIHRELAGEKGIRVFRKIEEALDWVFLRDRVT